MSNKKETKQSFTDISQKTFDSIVEKKTEDDAVILLSCDSKNVYFGIYGEGDKIVNSIVGQMKENESIAYLFLHAVEIYFETEMEISKKD